MRLRKPGYPKTQLKKLVDFLGEAASLESFVFFKHETEGAGPKMAGEFAVEVASKRNVKVA